jgi:glycosyltransferase involved in cell wall biosynthesis
MKDFSISIIFPAFNEEDNIGKAVSTTLEFIEQITNDYEIIIVDDGSRDGTGKIADLAAKGNPKIKVIHHGVNQGYGATLWSGIQLAKNDWIFYTDSDLQFDIKEIKKLIQYIPEYDAVLGYRSPRKDSFMRLANAKGWNTLVRLLFGLKVRDLDCAFKLLKRDIVASLPLQTRGATMSAEMLLHLRKRGVTWKEVPVSHFPRTFGSPTGAKPSVIIRAFRELFDIYLKGI